MENLSFKFQVGREEDESPAFVLPNHMLLKIATEVPREMQGILACCNPVPPLVKQNLGLLHTIILNARERQLVTVETTGAPGGGRDALPELPEVLENPLASPLDLAHLADLGQLETVIGSKKSGSIPQNNLRKKKPDLGVFKEEKLGRNKKSLIFVSPFKRLVLLKPYLSSLNKEEGMVNDKEQGEGLCTVKEVRSEMEDIRLENIKKVFDQLTSNTPKKVEKKLVEEDDDEEGMEEGEVEEDSDDEDEEGEEEEEPYFTEDQPYREATEKLKGLRAGAQQKARGGGGGRGGRGGGGGRGKPSKRPGSRLEQDEEVVEVKVAKKEEFNYDSVDFSKFGKKVEVDEGDEKRRKGQEKSGGGRQKQRFMKRGSKSSTFKR